MEACFAYEVALWGLQQGDFIEQAQQSIVTQLVDWGYTETYTETNLGANNVVTGFIGTGNSLLFANVFLVFTGTLPDGSSSITVIVVVGGTGLTSEAGEQANNIVSFIKNIAEL